MKQLFFLLLLLLILTGCSTQAHVQETPVASGEPDSHLDCPRGVTNDPFPGICGSYVDKNHDGLCDHGQ